MKEGKRGEGEAFCQGSVKMNRSNQLWKETNEHGQARKDENRQEKEPSSSTLPPSLRLNIRGSRV